MPGPPAAIRVDFDAATMRTIKIQGLANRTTGRALMPDDPVRIASISKFFVALGVMRLVQAGTLGLDRNVSEYLGWKVTHPAFPDDPITLRHLLSHQVGLRDGIDYALPMDARLEVELAKPEAWDMQHRPGAYFAYANLNSPLIAAVIEAATGKRFDVVMQEQVFEPLALDACFNWTLCSDVKVANAVTLYRSTGEVARDDLRGRRAPCEVVPASDGSCDLANYRLGQTGSIFSPQGGLRISANDLAKVGQIFLRGGDGFLKPETIAEMTRPAWVYDGTNGDTEKGFFCAFGLGVQILGFPGRPETCADEPFGDGKLRYGHAGEAYGLLSGLWWQSVDQTGTAFFRTEVTDEEADRLCIYFCN